MTKTMILSSSESGLNFVRRRHVIFVELPFLNITQKIFFFFHVY